MRAAGERCCLPTLVERATGCVEIMRLPHRTMHAVNQAVMQLVHVRDCPSRPSLGTTAPSYMAAGRSKRARMCSAIRVPARPRERGSNEDLKGLLRQHFLKRKGLARVRQLGGDRMADSPNPRSGKCHDFMTSHRACKDSHGCCTSIVDSPSNSRAAVGQCRDPTEDAEHA